MRLRGGKVANKFSVSSLSFTIFWTDCKTVECVLRPSLVVSADQWLAGSGDKGDKQEEVSR